MWTRNAGVVSSSPARAKVKTLIVKNATVNHHRKSLP